MSGMSWMRGVALVLGVAGAVAACGGDSGGSSGGGPIQTSKKGQIQLDSNPKANGTQLTLGVVAKDKETVASVFIKNTGDGTLHVSKIGFTYTAPDGAVEATPALEFREVKVGGVAQPVTGGTVTGLEIPVGGADIEAVVTYHNYDEGLRSGFLSIQSDTRYVAEQNLSITISTSAGAAVANVSPTLVDFKSVKKGDSPVKPIKVTNTGTSDLTISSVSFKGHIDFRFMYQDPNAKTGEGLKEYEPGEAIAWDPPILVKPQETATFLVRYTPEDSNPAEGQAIFYTNDQQQASGVLVTLQANLGGPCIQVNPAKVQFGGKLVGSKALLPVDLISCGTEAIKISNIQFVADSNPNFSLEYKSLGGDFADNSKPTAEKPLTIPVNAQATLNVIYVPSVKNPLGADGQPVFDKGTIMITSNAFEEEVQVEVSGLGVDKACPTAVIVVQEGEKVIPQTNLHLYGDQSFAPSGAIASWKWTVKQPTGAASVYVPSDTFPNPTFEVNTAGQYNFSLDVWDEAGVKSCVPAEVEVVVVPDEAIHVELLWHTPNDPDETDQGPEAGSDMDLHFIHDAYAASGPDLDKDGKPDGWFDQPFDCFWFNAHPNWGSFDPSIDDDPGLDRDDTDGAGPENLNLNIPENTTYRIGIHYWSDHEYGPSYVTLRIYIYSILVFEVTDVKLVNHDMWNAATIDWPSAKVTLVQKNGGYWITPAYQNPFFFQP